MDIWEQRENLSFTINKSASPLVNEIVKSIVKNKKFSWAPSQLTIEDEALVQRLLRERRVELRCYALDQFPTSTDEFIPLIIRIPFNLKALLTRKHQLIKFAISHDYNIILMVLVAIAGICWYGLDLLGWALLYSWLISNLMCIVMHEYWAHGYIEPKNKFIGYVLDVYMCSMLMFCARPRQTAKIHDYHHKYFHGNRDNIQYELDHNSWLSYIFKFNVVTDTKLNHWITEQSDSDFVAVYEKMDTVERWIEHNAIAILTVFHLVLFLVLGLHLYLYFMLLPILFHKLVFFYFSEVLTHKVYRDDLDMPWAFPIVCNTAWHNTHHLHLDKLVLGPGIIKYFNPQYYFIRLFYKIKSKII
jgi:hypothetical protein